MKLIICCICFMGMGALSYCMVPTSVTVLTAEEVKTILIDITTQQYLAAETEVEKLLLEYLLEEIKLQKDPLLWLGQLIGTRTELLMHDIIQKIPFHVSLAQSEISHR